MKAAYYEAFQGEISIQNLPDPTPGKDDVVVDVKATGLCRSDWHGWMGHDPDINLPHVPGHELAGVILEVGENIKNWKIGDRVTVPFVCGCGVCAPCSSGDHQVCDHQFQPGFTHWGSFAEYVNIKYADINLVRIPEEIDFITAASLGCRFVTSFRAVVAQGRTQPGQWMAVHGCGGVGLSAIMIGSALGASVIAIDIDDEKLQFATEMGACHTINTLRDTDIIEAVKDYSSGGVHVSIDALGHPDTCFNSISNLRKRGKHIQVGLMLGDHSRPQVPMDQVIAHELEILGSHGMQAHKYRDMLEMIKSGKLQPEKLIGNKISLRQSCEALTQMDQFKHKGVTVINEF